MTSPENTVAFIGLGVMGYPMAKNLRKGLGSDQNLVICDIDKDTIARFQEETAEHGPVGVVANGFEAAKTANAVITMLPDSSAVEAVYLDPTTGVLAGIFAAATSTPGQHKLIMECGTIETATIAAVSTAVDKLQATLRAQLLPSDLPPSLPAILPDKLPSPTTSKPPTTISFVDAPVSGGPMGAHAGTLAFMVGASTPASFAHARDSYLRHMGTASSIFHCGAVGAGTAFKIINNYLSAITSLAASEALNMGVKAGYDAALLTDVINASGGQCWVTSKANPVPGVQEGVPSSRGYEGGFRLELCAKVLGMGRRLAESVGARTVLDGPTAEAFEEAGADERYKGRDARVVYKWLSESERK